MSVVDRARERIAHFAVKHHLHFEERGEVGFGRPCVGLLRGTSYVAYNPTTYVYEPGDLTPSDFKRVDDFYDRALTPPESVEDAYHKDDCLAVLVHDDNYDRALLQLADWVDHLDRLGVEVAEYPTGARGVHMLVHGAVGYAIRRRPQGGQEP